MSSATVPVVTGYRRGEVLRGITSSFKIQILGGPNFIYDEDYYTARIVDHYRDLWIGRTFLCGLRDLARMQVEGVQPLGYPDTKVIYADCPECEEEMIFYEGDYICAWCREHLEEKV